MYSVEFEMSMSLDLENHGILREPLKIWKLRKIGWMVDVMFLKT